MFLVEVATRSEEGQFDFTFRDIRCGAEITHLCCSNGGKANWNIQRRKWTGETPEEWVFSCSRCDKEVKISESISEKKHMIDKVACQGGEVIIDDEIKVRRK